MAFIDGSFALLGRRFPVVAALILGLTVAGSIALANSLALQFALTLLPGAVWHGQVWRLVSWTFALLNPQDLFFWCVLFFFIGGDLAAALRPRRFLLAYLGLAVITALLVCLLALAWPGLRGAQFLAPWVLADACLVAWGLLNPRSQLLLMFVLPVSGRQVVWLTVAMVVIFAAMGGFVNYLPNFMAMGLAALYLRNTGLETLWLRMRYRWLQLRLGRRRSHLRAVERDEGEPPRWVH